MSKSPEMTMGPCNDALSESDIVWIFGLCIWGGSWWLFTLKKTKKPKKKPSLKAEEEQNLFNANDTKIQYVWKEMHIWHTKNH